MTQSPASPPPLYAPREPIFPRRVKGTYRTLKWWIMGVTLAIYYLTPWIRWDRGPNLPDQAVLVDLAGRRFYFFWIEIWPHEFYFVAGLLIMAGLGLFLFTSALGRVWCGYTCPQTVWTDLFILVERWIEGDRNARVRLWNADWSFHKVRLRMTKFIVWFFIALATGGAWVFYFADAPTLARDLVTFDAPLVAYSTMLILTATTFVFGGFMREQVCNYMCPWPRIQAAMMDESTLTVAYRHWRGEPRGKHMKAEDADQRGDCIDCMACVNVCPAGIDIRDGQQMECITCALCIDACDEVMERIGKPRGLIDYLALSDEEAETKGAPPRPILEHVLRPRTILYTAMWSLIGVALVYALFIRSDIDLTVEPVRNPQFVTLSDGAVRNAYTLRIRNLTAEPREFRVMLTSDDILRIDVESDGAVANHVTVPANETMQARVYVTARPQDPAADAETTDLRLWVEDVETDDRAGVATIFNGKG
ncbi:cytochrome c oxidase accessory protein CcoG [Tateyamaria omphalii]|uniref:Cytochrome c oxidase accessory protein CcoG n=1 Tax=Tateyamaria omphalii TaxID=299262 RepID=A0A1P8MRR2_9RHOB|nr:cytochrome c oxidase accessory protein CcoG [Tateyamaria omphalii]APX10767.1 cytochrome c oxidase accessory protein CcoG [Tateyamaria omphalii]